MIYTNGIDYNVTIKTPRYDLVPMSTENDFEDLQDLCGTEGFDYPYIHKHRKTMHLPLSERVLNYTHIGDDARNGNFGRTLINTIHPRGTNEFLGAGIMFAVSPNDPLFKGANPETDLEIGIFTHVNHWGKGIGKEVVHSMMAYTANQWGITRFWASIEPGRERSIAIMESAGMEQINFIPGGSPDVPYNNKKGNPAGRIIMWTPHGWRPEEHIAPQYHPSAILQPC